MLDTPKTGLQPPFAANHSLCSSPRTPLLIRQGRSLLRPNTDRNGYLHAEISVPRLNALHKYLWLAGLPRPARSLHRQKLMNRDICLTEAPDEHLLWHESRIFVKPLPEFMLDYSCWELELCIDRELYKCARGFLLSYAWLVGRQSDFKIAKEVGLLPDTITWDMWSICMNDVLDSDGPVNKRYEYGELRLNRLDTLYRLSPSPYPLQNFIFGYMPIATWYRAYFRRKFAWLLAAFVYVTVVLSALQVGLATDYLQKNSHFQNASYGFSVASLVSVLLSVVVAFIVWLVLFFYHFGSTILFVRSYQKKQSLHRW
jgi:hypothetical protein